MDEARLIDRLRLIESVFSGATTEGERIAAERARSRILERLKLWEKEDPAMEYRFSMADMWSRKVFVALLRRYGIRPYRYSGQRRTTVMARLPAGFVDEMLMPAFQEISDTLRSYLTEITDRVVHQVIHQDSSEAETIEEPGQLPLGLDAASSVMDSTSPGPAPDATSPPPAPGQARQGCAPGDTSRDAGANRRARNTRKKKKKKRKRR